MIEVKNLVKRYGNHIAVDHLSFTVEKGQILGFLGPNGAGKSTTMNIITGYISATEGTVTVNGHDVYEEPEEVKRMIGYLPEFPPLYPDMTIREYLNFVADIKKVSKSEKKQMVEEVMEATMITPMANRLIKHLSKGYKQRVGLAQAIMGYPELIILDEPTVGLDPKQIIEIRELIKNLSKNHTVILSSHIMQEVSAVCDTIMIIDKGKLILQDKPENLSARMGATGGIRLSVKGDKETIRNTLGSIDRILSIEELPAVEEGVYEFSISCNENEDIREDVFYAMCKSNTPILEMKSIRMSLEDIFLKVTNNYENSITSEENDKMIESEMGEAPDENSASEAEQVNMTEEEKSDAGDL
ncbi:ATP-binding cassette domain-containing protein [Lachnospiraceae bacterium MD1]|uniref:ATP-binding cassette domain-containing protein n=1 Tax=Variimorphobacter saccharofermentans TaxID=2755051 RepID=A0A839JWC2_9FIRM|nr:ATP-binding cassette domain-containing protein [Variimorphobacter saccharofermentans]MBB2181973.1 ATP-binding cassette domain-containing protein [Variimorphobacter saccharofermentans]